MDEILKENKDAKLTFMELDLSRISSVQAFAQRYEESKMPLHILINNAGLNSAPTTADGFEGIWQANFLGHFVLSLLLLPVLKQSAPSRVINVSSVMHRFAGGNWAKSFRTRHGGSYSDSKLAQMLQTLYWQHHIAPSTGVTSLCVHPGAVNSDIWRSTPSYISWLTKPLFKAVFLTTEQGCSTSVAAATMPSVHAKKLIYLSPYRGVRCLPFILSELMGPYAGSVETLPSKAARDIEDAQTLWDLCLREVKLQDGSSLQTTLEEKILKRL